MGFVTPDPSSLTYDPYLGAVRMADTGYGTLTNPFPINGFYIYRQDGTLVRAYVDNTNAWVIETYVAPSTAGTPMGLLLSLTYSS